MSIKIETIRDYVESLAKAFGNNLGKKYAIQLESYKDVKCVPLDEVLTQREIEAYKRVCKPRMKECYKNALLLCNFLKGHDVEYVEGYFTKYFPTEHAFCKIDGKYVDPTAELILGDDVTKNEYASIYECPTEVAVDVSIKNGYYGNVFNEYLIERLRKEGHPSCGGVD